MNSVCQDAHTRASAAALMSTNSGHGRPVRRQFAARVAARDARHHRDDHGRGGARGERVDGRGQWRASGCFGVRRVALAVHRLHFGVDDPETMWFNGDRFVETYPLGATSRSSHSYGSTVV
jgi:hypothetical protein